MRVMGLVKSAPGILMEPSAPRGGGTGRAKKNDAAWLRLTAYPSSSVPFDQDRVRRFLPFAEKNFVVIPNPLGFFGGYYLTGGYIAAPGYVAPGRSMYMYAPPRRSTHHKQTNQQ